MSRLAAKRAIGLSVTVVASLFLSPLSYAERAQCSAHYLKGLRPSIPLPSLQQKTKEICFSAFGVMYSGQTKTPLWAAYKLTPQRIKKASRIKRNDSFAPYTELPKSWRSELADYTQTGFDRGHLAPFAVMDSAYQGGESFYLTNIVPQHAAFNRGQWASIESRVRHYAKTHTVYVITGALFISQQIERINKRVLAPSHLYKLVYDPRKGQTIVFVATNSPKTQVRLMNAQELEAFSKGSLLLPALMKRSTRQLSLR